MKSPFSDTSASSSTPSLLPDKHDIAEQLASLKWEDARKIFTLDGLYRVIMFACVLSIGHMVATMLRQYVLNLAKKYDVNKESKAPTTEKESIYLASVVISSMAYYIVMTTIVVLAFHLIGVSLTGLIAWVGVFSVILGFALQGFLQDIVAGIVMACTGKFRVNDLISMGDGQDARLYTIESFNILNTTMRDLTTNAIATMSNRKVQEASISNVSYGEIYYVVYNIMAHHSNSDFEALARTITREVSYYPLVQASGEKASLGFIETNEHGTRLSLRVPVVSAQYTYDGVYDMGMYIREVLRKVDLILISGSITAFPKPAEIAPVSLTQRTAKSSGSTKR